MRVQPTTQQLIAMLYERLPELLDRPQRKPLTDEQRSNIAFRWRNGNGTASELIDMVEAAHGIKGDA